MPAERGCWLDEEALETLAGEQLREPCQYRPGGGLEHQTVNLALEDCYLVAEHDDFKGELGAATAGEPNQLEEAVERPVEEREVHRWMLAGAGARSQVQVAPIGGRSWHRQDRG